MQIKRLIVGSIETNCYILKSEGEIAVIDPGGDAGVILDKIKKENGRLKYIINTHGHEDHILANEKIRQETGAKILIHEADKVMIDFTPDRYIGEGDTITIGNTDLKVIHVPGHTPGGICLLGKNLIFTGDTIFLNGIGRTDLMWASEEDMEKSLRRLGTIIKPGMMVYPGHGGYTEYGG